MFYRLTYFWIARDFREKAGVVAVELGTACGRDQHHRPEEVGKDDHLQDERNDGPYQREYHAADCPAPQQTLITMTHEKALPRGRNDTHGQTSGRQGKQSQQDS